MTGFVTSFGFSVGNTMPFSHGNAHATFSRLAG